MRDVQLVLSDGLPSAAVRGAKDWRPVGDVADEIVSGVRVKLAGLDLRSTELILAGKRILP